MSAPRNHTKTPGGGPERLINAEAERLILGNILARGGEFWRIVGPHLKLEYFAAEVHRRVFVVLERIAAEGGEPGLESCYGAAIAAGTTPEGMGLPELSTLAFENQVELTNPLRWCSELRVTAAKRRAWRLAERLRLGLESGEGPEEIAKLREELRVVEAEFEPPEPAAKTIGDAVGTIGIDALLAATRGTIASPWERLNELTNGGPKPGEMLIIGARPSVGKTTAALQWSVAAAAAGQRVLFVSLEMPRQDLLKRVLSAEGTIPHGLLVRGGMDSAWRLRVAQTLERIGDYPLEITDKLRTLSAIVARVAAGGFGLLVVDYLGLVDPGSRYENRNQEVSAISRRLKLCALDYGICVVAAHQLNRGSDTENRPPQLSDLRDSGSLEQDADVVLLLDAPASRKRAEQASRDAVDLIIAKQRNGARGESIHLHLEGKYCRIVESHREAQVA